MEFQKKKSLKASTEDKKQEEAFYSLFDITVIFRFTDHTIWNVNVTG